MKKRIESVLSINIFHKTHPTDWSGFEDSHLFFLSIRRCNLIFYARNNSK